MKAKLFCGVMYRDKSVFYEALEMVKEEFGDIEKLSDPYDFSFTSHYENEMGRELKKRFVVFKLPIDRTMLAEAKLFTNTVEKKLSVGGNRRINIDPGYFTQANLVLASTKEFPHRVYLKCGIYAEVTLLFKKDGCFYLDWTYQDFRRQKTRNFFFEVRNETFKQ